MKRKLLIIDDNEDILEALKFTLRRQFDEIKTIKNPNQINHALENEVFDIIVLDMNFTAGINNGNEGFFWLKKILSKDPSAVVILITAYGDVEIAVKAIKEGATDFVTKPWENEKLIATLESAYKLRKSKLEVNKLQGKQKHLTEYIQKEFDNIVGNSPAIQKVLQTVKKVASTDANVLILGENGTGKELIAREIHKMSKRVNEVFVTIDIASLNENLIESEIFGHVKGAFTDAREDRMGRFEIANGGSVFLDEIGNLTYSSQSKLLTVLQNRKVTRVGATKPVDIDVRLISATNKSIEEMIKNGTFREDLFYRINTIQIVLPPLRERHEDIPLLIEYYLRIFANKYDKKDMYVSSAAMKELKNYPWYGNIRELKHTVEKAIILADKKELSINDFFQNNVIKNNTTNYDQELLNLEEIEKIFISKAITKHEGNLSNAAKELGITRATLYNKIEKYGI